MTAMHGAFGPLCLGLVERQRRIDGYRLPIVAGVVLMVWTVI